MHFSSFAIKLSCPHCSQIHRTNRWPINGDRTSFYYQKEEGRFNLPVICPHCKKVWYVVWDEDPGTIMTLDL